MANNNEWEGQAPGSEWEGQAPAASGWEGQAPDKAPKYSFEKVEKTTKKEDFIRGAKDLAKSKITEASMAAAGLGEIEKRSIFGVAGRILRDTLGLPNVEQKQIFQNMETANKTIEEGTDSGEGKERGTGGRVIAALPGLADVLASGKGSGVMTVAQMGKKSFIDTSAQVAPQVDNATDAIAAGAIKSGADMLSTALPVGMGWLKGALTGAGGNVVSEVVGNRLVENYLRSQGQDTAADQFNLDPKTLDATAIIGGVTGGVVGRYGAKAEADADARAREANIQIRKELEAIQAETTKDVDASNIRSPYMKPKALAESQAYADQTNEPGNRLLTPTIKNPRKHTPIGQDDAAMAEAMRIAENDAYANEQGWTGQEPGIGKGEVLEDVDTAAAKNPYLSTDEQAYWAQRNALQGKGPAYGEMDFQLPKDFTPGPWPTKPDATLYAAIKSADRVANAKGSLEKAQAKADAAADLIKTDLVMAEQGAAIKDSTTEVGEPAKVQVPEPPLPPDVNPKNVNEVADKVAAQLDPAFLRIASKRGQGGHIDLTEYTSIGFRDLVEGMKKASYRLWNSLAPEQRETFKDAYFVDKQGIPVPLGHGTQKNFTDYKPELGDGGMLHFGDIGATHIINDRNVKTNYTLYNVDGTKEVLPAFRAYLIDYAKSNNTIDIPDKTVNKLREEWYQDRLRRAKEFEEKNTKQLEQDFKVIEEYFNTHTIKKYMHGTDQKSKQVRDIVIRYGDALMGENSDRLRPSHLEPYLERFDITEWEGKVKELLQEAKNETLRYIHNTGAITDSHHIRPLFTSIKNPIWIRDMGSWYDLNALARELFYSRREETTQFFPLDFEERLSPEQRAELKPWVEQFFKDLDEVEKSKKTTLATREQDIKILRKKLYSKLEELGFDGFLYENRAEAITSGEIFGHGEAQKYPNTPTFSVATWKADKVHDWFSLRRQGGYIDPKVFIEGAKKVAKFLGKPFQKAYDYGDWVAAKANNDLFENAEGMLRAYKPEDTPDLPSYGKNIPTVNQLKLFMDHPWFNYTFGEISKSKREANVRHLMYADALKDVFKLSRKEQISLFKKLVDIQDPELYDRRSMAEGTNTREQFLLEQGLDPKLVPHAIRVLDVLKHSYIKDNESTERVGREPFNMEPMYFPRAHTGKFNVTIRTPTNDVKYATGFDSGVDAQKFVKDLREQYKAQVDKGELEIEVHRNHYGASSDIFSVMALDQAVPQSIAAIASGIEKHIEVAKRTFELHRAKEGVGGYVGEILADEKSWKGRLENDKLLNLLQNRLRSSHDWEVRSKIINKIKGPLFDDISILHDKPEFRSFVGQLINRELGHDIGANKIERGMQKAVEDASKTIDKWFFARQHGYEGGDLALVSPKALQETAQAWTYLTSLIKLSLNPPVLVANATAIPLVGIDGARTAAKLKLGQHYAIAAYMDTLAYVGHKDQAATKFMQEAIKEGMIEPHIAETYDLAETSQHHAGEALGDLINKPRNLIEKGTNFTAILYYYNFYKRAAPNLKPDALKQMVYESARSYTGDYSQQAMPLMFSQAGSAGRLMTNFAKWKWNQIGRFADDMKDAKNGNYTPIALNLATQVLVGGIYGTAGVVDYEALRRLGKMTGLWDWRPFTGFFDSVQDGLEKNLGLDPSATEWARRGALNEATSMAAKALNLQTSPDLSGTMRHASALEAPTVAMAMAKSVFVDALPTSLKWLWQEAGGPTKGVTLEEKEAALGALPPLVQGTIRHYWDTKKKFGKDFDFEKMQNPGEVITHSKFNEKGIYKRSQQEQLMASLNFRSATENNFMDKQFYNSWLKANRTKQITDSVKGILANQDNPELFMSNIEDLAVLGGAQTVRNLLKQLKDNEMNKSLTADEQAAFAMLQTLDPTRKRFMIEQMNRLVESRNTSSNR